MLDRSALRNFRPIVMTPTHDGTFCLTYVVGIIQLMATCHEIGMPMNFMFQAGDSLVTRARNHLVAMFLSEPQWIHLMWIDADIGFSPEAVFRLLLSDHDIAAGVYPLKREDWPTDGVPAGTTHTDFMHSYTHYTVNTGRTADPVTHLEIDADGFIALREAPTGFMLIKRQVLERMVAAHPELHYQPDMIGSIDPQYYYRLFDVSVDPETGRYLSEDYGFCRIWEALGGSIYVDANSNLAHMGSKIFRGDFGGSLRRNAAQAVGMIRDRGFEVTGLDHLTPNPPGAI